MNKRLDLFHNRLIKVLIWFILIGLLIFLPNFDSKAYLILNEDCPPSSSNLALGKQAFASSIERVQYLPANATDGNLENFWSSRQWTQSEWIYVDLGDIQTIEQVILRWVGPAYSENYSIDFSNDAINWTTVSIQEAKNPQVHIIPVSGSARYVRMNGISRGTTGFGHALWEFEVYDHENCEVPLPQVRPPDPIPNEYTMFFDDFEDGLDSNWIINRGNWYVTNGVLEGTVSCDDHSFMSIENPSWTDYEVQFDFRGVQGAGKDFMFRYVDDTNDGRYLYLVERGWIVWLQGGGQPATLVEDFRIYQGIWHRTRIRVEGDNIKIFIDDQLVLDRTDTGTTRLNGGIGPYLRTGPYNCPMRTQYDNILVSNLIPPNKPPTVYSGGAYTVNEGGAVQITASGSDPDNDPLSYAWDLDNDGVFETQGKSVIYSAADDDGPGGKIIIVEASDLGGLTATDQAYINIINVSPSVGPISAQVDPIQINTVIATSADFTDPGILDTHTAEWDWGDNTTSIGDVIEVEGSGSVTGNHVYTSPGVYTIKVTVTDKDGDSDYSIYQYAVVFNPEGSFVTGGGWIDSPEGAYTEDPLLLGKANFGFVSKYKKGATIPTGVTQFQFNVADLNFHSNYYQWLVVAGARAQFKGEGTINGEGYYKFFITAIDGDINGGGGKDKFRIKIWWEENDIEHIIYDNQMGKLDDGDPTTQLGGGSIVIHK